MTKQNFTFLHITIPRDKYGNNLFMLWTNILCRHWHRLMNTILQLLCTSILNTPWHEGTSAPMQTFWHLRYILVALSYNYSYINCTGVSSFLLTQFLLPFLHSFLICLSIFPLSSTAATYDRNLSRGYLRSRGMSPSSAAIPHLRPSLDTAEPTGLRTGWKPKPCVVQCVFVSPFPDLFSLLFLFMHKYHLVPIAFYLCLFLLLFWPHVLSFNCFISCSFIICCFLNFESFFKHYRYGFSFVLF